MPFCKTISINVTAPSAGADTGFKWGGGRFFREKNS